MLVGCDYGLNAPIPAAPSPATPNPASLSVVGTWDSPCNNTFFRAQLFTLGRQITQTYQNNKNFKIVDKVYADLNSTTADLNSTTADCTAANLIEIVTTTGQYTLGNTVDGQTNIDRKNIKIEALMKSGQGVELANSSFTVNYGFGYGDHHLPWVLNTPRVVTYTIGAKNLYYPGEISITPATRSPAPPANPPSAITALDIFQVTATGRVTKLYLGNKGHLDGNSTNERPLTLDKTDDNTSVKRMINKQNKLTSDSAL